ASLVAPPAGRRTSVDVLPASASSGSLSCLKRSATESLCKELAESGAGHRKSRWDAGFLGELRLSRRVKFASAARQSESFADRLAKKSLRLPKRGHCLLTFSRASDSNGDEPRPRVRQGPLAGPRGPSPT